jgi:TPR repeat protein
MALLETTSKLVNGTPNQVHRKTVLPLSCLGGCCQNKTKAVELFEKSARLGYGGAMYLLGTCCKHGRGVTTDATQSQEWLAKAVVQGCTPPTDVTN